MPSKFGYEAIYITLDNCARGHYMTDGLEHIAFAVATLTNSKQLCWIKLSYPHLDLKD